ncbi:MULTISPECIES: pilus assembly protein PilP [unclassified Halomonas]|uniref:pilus assembly protein PilP n=1 Tax=unclassified Halomonas TaxID=2609666 RepID=UPI001BE52DDC|nr:MULTISPECIES: pilus assembly protein PilP [unclassified Halomonas]MBT2786703.1 pilus assembly protein PilP [Halomonas sp. ISL-106]MBT2798645.1 pilus assembly protein PilP [Halomonas sp. ISL-104]
MTAKQKTALPAVRAASAISLAFSAAMLTGCADADLAQLEDTLAAIRHSPGGQPPVMVVALPESRGLSYLYSDGRSPFLPPEAIAQGGADRNEGVLAPDPQRTPEPLERFSLQELRLVGTMRMGGRQVALISSPDGNVTSVKEGNYLGSDYGRIAQISAQEIRVTERVFTPREGWQERQVSLVINENNE